MTSTEDLDCGSDAVNTSNDQSAADNYGSTFSTANKGLMKYESLEIFHTPLCMIDADPDRKPKINQDVLDQIAKIDSELNIVAITGPYRTGKSYLLNRLANARKGFQVTSAVEGVTKGIWVWCRPHPKFHDQVLLLLYTEGLGDIQKNGGEFENHILVLAILLCSTFIYNFKGALDRSVLEKLRFVMDISKRITLSDEISGTDCEDFDLYFPFFLLVLRDVDLDIKDDDENAYFEETVLALKPGSDDHGMKETRRCIRNHFKRRKCFAFTTPGIKKITKILQPLPVIEEEFILKSKQFTDFVHDKCPPKQINHGQTIDGEKFAILTRTYVEELRGGNLPNVKKALNAVAQQVNIQAVQKCVELYQSKMKNMLQFPTSSSETLQEAHQTCWKAATSLFVKDSIYEKDGKSLQLAIDRLFTAYGDFKLQDDKASIQKSETALEQLYADIAIRMKNQFYFCSGGYNLYQKDIKKLKTKYKDINGLGCKKAETLSEYLSNRRADKEQVLKNDTSLTEKERQKEVQSQKDDEVKRQQRDKDRFQSEQKQILEVQQERLQNLHRELQAKYKEDMEKQEKRFEEILEKRLQEEKRLLKEGCNAEAAKLKAQITNLKIRKIGKLKKKIAQCNNLSTFTLIGRGLQTMCGGANKM